MAAAVLTLPGTAVAADGLPPEQPLVADLTTGSKPCAAGQERPYVSSLPQLGAVLNDPEGGQVSAEYEVWWTDAEGAEQRTAYTTTAKRSGSAFNFQLPTGIPADTAVSWRVRADDGTALSPWSSDGAGTACEFVYDNVSPQKPAVTSPDYTDEGWQDGVGVYGSFVFDSPSEDVVAYTYWFKGGTLKTVEPAVPGGPATVRHLPLDASVDFVTVRAVDRAGRGSAETTYQFRVASGRAPVAHWNLSDAPGSYTAAAETGSAAAAGDGVTFGAAGPSGTGLASVATLDGSGGAHLTPGTQVVGSGKTFAVSAWVRPARTDRDMTAASQSADGGTAFDLGLRAADGAAPV